MEEQIDYEKIATVLKQRVGELVSQYETDMAALRANAQNHIDRLNGVINDLKGRLNALEEEHAGNAEANSAD